MRIHRLQVSGYRSIREIRLPLRQINVLTGPNGCGKSNLYQSMYLLGAAAGGELARALAAEGGMPSALWAGPRRKRTSSADPVRLVLGVQLDEISYELQCGLPPLSPGAPTQFKLDPDVKEERIAIKIGRSQHVLMQRDSSTVMVRDLDGNRLAYPMSLSNSESVLAQLQEPHRYPQLSAVRQHLIGWRFYHHFRTDSDAPLRHPQVGVRTSVLDHDGRHLAAALQTILEVGDRDGLERAIDEAFPGAQLIVESPQARFALQLQMPGINRPFEARELSDGTLRYLCLLAALLSPRPPALLALNEPETSLHPDLLAPLARLISDAARYSQLWITTHSQALAEAIGQVSGEPPVCLEKVDGETMVAGREWDA